MRVECVLGARATALVRGQARRILTDAVSEGLNQTGQRLVRQVADAAPRVTSHLARSFQYRMIGKMAVKVGSIQAGTNTPVIYAAVREYGTEILPGGRIFAKNKPYLVFKIDGEWKSVKSVYQKGSFFFRDSTANALDIAREEIEAAIDRSPLARE